MKKTPGKLQKLDARGLTPREAWAAMLCDSYSRAMKRGDYESSIEFGQFLGWQRQEDVDHFQKNWPSAAEKLSRPPPPRNPGGTPVAMAAL